MDEEAEQLPEPGSRTLHIRQNQATGIGRQGIAPRITELCSIKTSSSLSFVSCKQPRIMFESNKSGQAVHHVAIDRWVASKKQQQCYTLPRTRGVRRRSSSCAWLAWSRYAVTARRIVVGTCMDGTTTNYSYSATAAVDRACRCPCRARNSFCPFPWVRLAAAIAVAASSSSEPLAAFEIWTTRVT